MEADFRRGEALLSTDSPLQDATLATAVQDVGYKPGPIEPLKTIAVHDSDLVEYRLAVEGMTCADCERHVGDALRAAGAIDVEANFRHGEAHFAVPAARRLAVPCAARHRHAWIHLAAYGARGRESAACTQ